MLNKKRKLSSDKYYENCVRKLVQNDENDEPPFKAPLQEYKKLQRSSISPRLTSEVVPTKSEPSSYPLPPPGSNLLMRTSEENSEDVVKFMKRPKLTVPAMSQSELNSLFDSDSSEFNSDSEGVKTLRDKLTPSEMNYVAYGPKDRYDISQSSRRGTNNKRIIKKSNAVVSNERYMNSEDEPRISAGKTNSGNQDDLKYFLKRLTGEVMQYEIRIASLYGRMAAIQKENQDLRDDIKSLSEKNFAQGSTSLQKSENKVRKNCSSIYKEGSATDNDMDVYGRRCIHDEKKTHLGELLVTGIDNRLKEYERVQENLETRLQSYQDMERTQNCLLNEESPLIKDLRSKLVSTHAELKKVREYGNVRVANLKGALSLEKANAETLHKKLAEFRLHIADSSKYVTEAAKHLKIYKQDIERQKREIKVLREKVSQQGTTDSPSDECQGNEKYSMMASDQNALRKVMKIQENDILTLNEQLDEEKLKNKALSRTLENYNRGKPINLLESGQKLDKDGLKTRSENRANLHEQQSLDKEGHHERIQEIHKLYRRILSEKDLQHQKQLDKMKVNIQKTPCPLKSPPPIKLTEMTDSSI